ncbi:hypothetical protein [Actinopolyspora halophila]|uniref:hypothetical protein n=1 Tax=Actinopolyspora halophila TaxID=1850 RepID=UPI000372FFD8|nr:hypothetical protein [Actinopolyspora halophila]
MPPPLQLPPDAEQPCSLLPNAGSLVCRGKDAAGDAVGSAASNAIEAAADAFSEAVANLTGLLLTFWTRIDTPQLNSPDGPVAFLRESTWWITSFVLVISLMIAGARMAITQSAEPGMEAAKGLWQMVLYSSAGIPGIYLLGAGGDAFSVWIIDRATDSDLGGRIRSLFGFSELGPLGPGAIIIIALFAILSALAQMMLMIVRVGMLVLLAGMLPLSAAAAVSKGGKEWFSKTLGWLLAFAAYKPAAAIVYAAAFALVGKGDSPKSVLSGIFLIALSVVALPALLRLTVPATGAIAASMAGGGASAIGAAGSVASGAMQLRGGGGGGGSGGNSSGGSSPSSSGQPTGANQAGMGAGAAGGQSAGSGAAGSGASGAGSSGAAAGAGSAGSAGGGAASGAGSAAGAAGAGAAAGPAGAGVAAGVQAVQQGVQAAQGAAESQAGDESGSGPTGSSQQGGQS